LVKGQWYLGFLKYENDTRRFTGRLGKQIFLQHGHIIARLSAKTE